MRPVPRLMSGVIGGAYVPMAPFSRSAAWQRMEGQRVSHRSKTTGSGRTRTWDLQAPDAVHVLRPTAAIDQVLGRALQTRPARRAVGGPPRPLLPWLHPRVAAGRAGRRDHRRGVRRRLGRGRLDAGVHAGRGSHHATGNAGSFVHDVVTRGPAALGRPRHGLDAFGRRGRKGRLPLARLPQARLRQGGPCHPSRNQQAGEECCSDPGHRRAHAPVPPGLAHRPHIPNGTP